VAGVFDGDYVTTTVAICDHDPLQTCADAAIAALVHDRWLIRRLPALMTAAGWQLVRTRGYVETTQAQYMLTLVDRGADTLTAAASITKDTAEALKEQARRRVREHIAARDAVLERVCGWLVPGGWIYISDCVSFSVESTPNPIYENAMRAWVRSLAKTGTDYQWGRSLPLHL
jgi:hypothetical protein